MDQAKQKDLVKLSLLNGKALTFDPDDYMKLRTDHRIVAKLIGVPVSNARNSQVNGLPAFYNEYEVQLLLEKGVVILDDKTGLKDSPSNDVKLMYEQHQQKIIAELHKPYIDSKLKSTIINMESIIRGKTKKLINSGIPESGESIVLCWHQQSLTSCHFRDRNYTRNCYWGWDYEAYPSDEVQSYFHAGSHSTSLRSYLQNIHRSNSRKRKKVQSI